MQKTVEHYQSYLNRFGIDSMDNENTLFFTTMHGRRQKMSDDNVVKFLKNMLRLRT